MQTHNVGVNAPVDIGGDEQSPADRPISHQLDELQARLDIVGLAPAYGNAADIVNAVISVFRGNYVDAALSAGAVIPVIGQGITSAKIATRTTRQVLSELPDSALVCRGGTCSADRFRGGSGVTIDDVGNLRNVSVNSARGKSIEQLSRGIPNRQVGITFVGDVRAAGGNVVRAPAPGNPNHAILSGVSPEQAERLFTPTIFNPNR